MEDWRSRAARTTILHLPSSIFHLRLPFDEGLAEDEDVHFGAEEAVEGFFGFAHHGFVFVEGCVEDHGHGCE